MNTETITLDWARLQQPLSSRFESATLLALSGRVHDQASFDRGLSRLSVALPVHGADCNSAPFQRFAADDAQRQQWLDGICDAGDGQVGDGQVGDGQRGAGLQGVSGAQAVSGAQPTRGAHETNAAPSVKGAQLLLGVRGGYGITRLLQRAPLADIAKRMVQTQSVLCGHSDFTALHLALMAVCLRNNLPVPLMLQGPMLCIDWGAEPAVERTFSEFMRMFNTGDAAEVCVADGLNPLADVETSTTLQGLLWGGNLSMICALVGTPYMPTVEGGLLFIEDVNEHPYRIERMLLQLHQAGVLGQQKALIVGECSDWKPSPLDHGYGLADALTHISQVSGVPIFTELRFGHIADKTCLPVGQSARLSPLKNGRASLYVNPL